MTAKPCVVINLLGTMLDRGIDASRWNHWRPSVAICMQDDFTVARYHLLHQSNYQVLADRVASDIKQVSPETEVLHEIIEFQTS